MILARRNNLLQYPVLVPQPLWQRALFCGICVAPNTSVPTLGLAFRNPKAAIELFSHWHHLIGDCDEDDVLNVRLVFGRTANLPLGFFLRISPNHQTIGNLIRLALQEGPAEGVDMNLNGSGFEVTHFRPTTVPIEDDMREFLEALRRSRGLYALCAYDIGRSGPRQIKAPFLIKHSLGVRSVDQIRKSDPDACVHSLTVEG